MNARDPKDWYAKYVSDFRIRLISKLRDSYALVRGDVEQFIQSFTTEYLNAERMKGCLTDRDLILAEKNKQLLELQHRMKQLTDAKDTTGTAVVSVLHKYRSGTVSPAEILDRLITTLAGYGWNVPSDT